MRFSREMHHTIDSLVLQKARDSCLIGDVAKLEAEVRPGTHGFKRREVAGIGELVDDNHPVATAFEQKPAYG
jgi:hypothetical protein